MKTKLGLVLATVVAAIAVATVFAQQPPTNTPGTVQAPTTHQSVSLSSRNSTSPSTSLQNAVDLYRADKAGFIASALGHPLSAKERTLLAQDPVTIPWSFDELAAKHYTVPSYGDTSTLTINQKTGQVEPKAPAPATSGSVPPK